ncbi:MAG: xylulokinase [Ignavibacteria bacterium]|jgi:xylulokinase|nr:xylulokinase [Ignavibacteria bacterium]MCU7505019.1 xylulokinase [Ignavibacteria bacterium]MCU7514847.1 xylulokinase [Ignavibacteria bacterium]
MSYFIGLDVGTTGAKALIIDQDGRVLGSATTAYEMSTPRPLWAEQNPEDWWNASKISFRRLLGDSGIRNQDVRGLGLTGQMHGLVLLDEKGNILRPCIMWNDQRTIDECREMTDKAGFERLLRITGNPVLPGFTAPKILWVGKNEPEIYKQIAHILLPKDYIRYRLTGEFATDVSDASGTSLLDVNQRNWSGEILSLVNIRSEWLPKVYESPFITGKVTSEAASMTLLCEGTPVVGGGGDQAAGAVGTGTVRQGITSVVLGTSGVVFTHTDKLKIEPEGRLHAFCHAVPGTWHLMGVTLAAAGSFRWFRDVLGDTEISLARHTGQDAYEILTREASLAERGSEGLLFLPYLSGERTPYPDPDAKGTFLGLTLRHSKPHLVRSVLEGVAFSLRDCLELNRSMGINAGQIRLSGGGARSSLWRQILADVFNSEIVTLTSTEGAPYGAALLAAVGTGEFNTVEEACDRCLAAADYIEPDAEGVKVYEDYYGIYKEMYPMLKNTFKTISRTVNKEFHSKTKN